MGRKKGWSGLRNLTSQELGDLLESTNQPRIDSCGRRVPFYSKDAQSVGLAVKLKRNKYRAERCVAADGQKFDSKAEMKRWELLKLLETQGLLKDLKRQVRFDLVVNGVDCGHYKCDFDYVNQQGQRVVEDVKSEATKTAVYGLKKKLVAAIHGIFISEIISQ